MDFGSVFSLPIALGTDYSLRRKGEQERQKENLIPLYTLLGAHGWCLAFDDEERIVSFHKRQGSVEDYILKLLL